MVIPLMSTSIEYSSLPISYLPPSMLDRLTSPYATVIAAGVVGVEFEKAELSVSTHNGVALSPRSVRFVLQVNRTAGAHLVVSQVRRSGTHLVGTFRDRRGVAMS